MPYTPHTERLLAELASCKPKTLAAMHGSAFVGDGEKALLDLGPVLKEILGSEPIGQRFHETWTVMKLSSCWIPNSTSTANYPTPK